jgi:hypothetical protein
MSELEPGDKKAAFTGLVVTALLLFILAFSLVMITNRMYAGGEGAHAGSTK